MTAGAAPTVEDVRAVVVGAGFFGCRVALFLAQHLREVVLVEREGDLLLRASYANQARVHQGYHYPRSLLTALRSRLNFARFLVEYPECIDDSFEKVYAVGRHGSLVTARQFRTFCERIGAPLRPVPETTRRLFDPRHVEEVFGAHEVAFDAVRLRARLRRDLATAGISVRLGTSVRGVSPGRGGGLDVSVTGPGGDGILRARQVFNCTYSGINHVLQASGVPSIPLKHEVTEMALVVPPPELARRGVTVMCGPFFSIMPFPPRGLHTLSHVRYTPHQEWHDRPGQALRLEGCPPDPPSHQLQMILDASRYVPCIADCAYRESIWEVKTVLPASEQDDSRPILFRPDPVLPGLTCIMGGKIDNVYDVMNELEESRARGGLD